MMLVSIEASTVDVGAVGKFEYCSYASGWLTWNLCSQAVQQYTCVHGHRTCHITYISKGTE